MLFDWDNTLIESWPPIHDAINTTLAAMGHRPWTFEETQRRVRRSLRDSFPELFGARWEEARDIYYRRFAEIHLEALAARPGAEALIDTLGRRGIYLAVVSNKSGAYLRLEAARLGWDRHFARLVGANDAPADKPAPEAVALALDGSAVAPGPDVWFVGDTAIDVACARNANLTAVVIAPDGAAGAEFSGQRPDYEFRDCAALAALACRF